MIALFAGGAVVALIVLVVRARRHRAANLSGTVADKPVFQLEPPRRRLNPLKDERL